MSDDDTGREPVRQYSDTTALDVIAHDMSRDDWDGADMLDRIAAVVRATGRRIP